MVLRITRLCAAFVLSVLLFACEGAKEREAAYLQRGKTFFEAGEFQKARLEFSNARQINPLGVEALYYLGRIDEKRGRLRRAFVTFTKVTEQDPTHLGAMVRLGYIYLLAGDFDPALEKADYVVVNDPENADAHALRGAVFLRRDQLDEATSEAEAALATDPKNISAIAVLAGTYRKLDRHADAVNVLRRAIEAIPENITLRLIKISLHVEKKEIKEVKTQFGEVFRLQPDNLRHRLNLAKLYISWDRRDDAEKLLRDSVAAAPDNEKLKILLVDFLTNQRSFEEAERELTGFINRSPEKFIFRFGLAALYERNELEVRAETIFSKIVELSGSRPEGLRARTALARMALAKGDTAAAQEQIETVLKQDRSNGEALILLARINLLRKAYEDGIADLRKVLRDNPTSRQALELITRAHLRTGRPELAIDNLWVLVETYPLNHSARIRLATLLARQNNLDTALNLLDLVLKRVPGHVSALIAKVEVLQAKGRFAEAEAGANRIAGRPKYVATGQRLLGNVYLGQGRPADAAVAFRSALDQYPDDRRSLSGLVRALVAQDQGGQAVEFLMARIETSPENAFVRNLLGEVYFVLKKPELAVEAFLSATGADRKWPVPYLRVAILRVRAGDAQGAVEILKEGTTYVPESEDLRLALGVAYVSAEDFELAAEVFNSMLEANPRLKAAANNLAAVIADHQYDDPAALDQALKLAERFQTSENPYFLDTLGWVHYRRGNRNQATIFLRRAVDKAPDTPQIRYHLGVVYHENGQADLARKELKKAVAEGAEYPELADARGLLAKLQ